MHNEITRQIEEQVNREYNEYDTVSNTDYTYTFFNYLRQRIGHDNIIDSSDRQLSIAFTIPSDENGMCEVADIYYSENHDEWYCKL